MNTVLSFTSDDCKDSSMLNTVFEEFFCVFKTSGMMIFDVLCPAYTKIAISLDIDVDERDSCRDRSAVCQANYHVWV